MDAAGDASEGAAGEAGAVNRRIHKKMARRREVAKIIREAVERVLIEEVAREMVAECARLWTLQSPPDLPRSRNEIA